MGYYAVNPYEEPESPECEECGEDLVAVGGFKGRKDWECQNPDCPNCPEKYKVDESEVTKCKT